MTERLRVALAITFIMLIALVCAGQETQAVFPGPEPVAVSTDTPATPPERDHGFSSAVVAAPEQTTGGATPAANLVSQSQYTMSSSTPAPASTPVQPAATNLPPAGFQQRYPRYVLRAGDVFDLVFEYSPEFNQAITVQPDGFITLREVGDIHVQGLTTEQVTQSIRKAYAKILNEPSIAIIPKLFEQPFIVVGGEVKSPGKFELRGTTTVAQAVALAGGFTDAAKHSHVLLFRRESPDGVVEVKSLNVKHMLNKGDLTEDAQLRPGDMIYVPQNTLSKVKGFIVPRVTVGPTVRPRP